MKTEKKRVAAKGDRLNWTPLKDLKPVDLSTLLVSSHALTESELKARYRQPSKFLLVP